MIESVRYIPRKGDAESAAWGEEGLSLMSSDGAEMRILRAESSVRGVTHDGVVVEILPHKGSASRRQVTLPFQVFLELLAHSPGDGSVLWESAAEAAENPWRDPTKGEVVENFTTATVGGRAVVVERGDGVHRFHREVGRGRWEHGSVELPWELFEFLRDNAL